MDAQKQKDTGQIEEHGNQNVLGQAERIVTDDVEGGRSTEQIRGGEARPALAVSVIVDDGEKQQGPSCGDHGYTHVALEKEDKHAVEQQDQQQGAAGAEDQEPRRQDAPELIGLLCQQDRQQRCGQGEQRQHQHAQAAEDAHIQKAAGQKEQRNDKRKLYRFPENQAEHDGCQHQENGGDQPFFVQGKGKLHSIIPIRIVQCLHHLEQIELQIIRLRHIPRQDKVIRSHAGAGTGMSTDGLVLPLKAEVCASALFFLYDLK